MPDQNTIVGTMALIVTVLFFVCDILQRCLQEIGRDSSHEPVTLGVIRFSQDTIDEFCLVREQDLPAATAPTVLRLNFNGVHDA